MAEFLARICLAGGGLLSVALLVGYLATSRRVRRTRAWMTTRGEVLRSTVEARAQVGSSSTSGVTNVPKVEYAYRVGDRELRGERISFAAVITGPELEETLARYPVGAAVDVHYDPDRPEQAVLERDVPRQVLAGLELLLVCVVGATLISYYLLTRGVADLEARLPAGARPELVAIFGGLGVFLLLLALAQLRIAAAAARWPRVAGEVVRTRVDRERRSHARQLSAVSYAPRVVYRYRVGDRDYEGDRLRLGARLYHRSEERVLRMLEAYPPGKEVQVHHDPQSPSDSALDVRPRGLWLLALLTLVLLAAALAMALPGE